MCIAIIGAAAIQDYLEAVLVILIFSLAELIEKWCMVYVRNLLTNSISEMPSTV